jgi:DNA-binding NarL/FixJ family response regulator
LLERNAAAKVIMFSMNDDPVFVAQAIEIGAKGYISKNDDPARMIDAIRAVANGGTTWPDGATERIAYLGGGSKPRTAIDRGGETTTVPVSTREHEILRHLAKGRSLSEIADLVGVSYKTIAQSCVQMRSRFGARTQMELVRIAVERKLV